MTLLGTDIRARVLENGRKQAPVRGTTGEIDFQPAAGLSENRFRQPNGSRRAARPDGPSRRSFSTRTHQCLMPSQLVRLLGEYAK